jgi:hypothetical protein
MKLLYATDSGIVLARYSDLPNPLTPDFVPTAGPGQTMIDVPTDQIPQAITHVRPDGTFVIEKSFVDQQWSSVKTLRNSLLLQSDWICSVTDYTVSNKAEWIAYRQALRELTHAVNPYDIVWPIPPATSSSTVHPTGSTGTTGSTSST